MKRVLSLDNKLKFYLDSNIFFFAKIMDGVFGKSASAILRKIASKELEATTSVLVPLEVANAMRKYGLAMEVPEEVRAIFSLGIEIYPIDSTDAREAAEIYGEVGISPSDCLHAALMRKNGVREIISADKDFDKITWLKRMDPRKMTT